MSIKGKLRRYAKRIGNGEPCPKCISLMERRERVEIPKNKNYYFKEWDYCGICSHVQHYEKFKVYLK